MVSTRAKAAAKAKFDVYPSAYANGWAAKKYKAMGGGWKSVSEQHADEGKFKPVQPKMVQNTPVVSPRPSNDSARVKLKEDKMKSMRIIKDLYKKKGVMKEEVMIEEEIAGWIAHYNGQKHEIKGHEAKDLYGAKQKAIAHFKIPKSKHGLLSVKPGVNEEVSKDDHSAQSVYDKAHMAYMDKYHKNVPADKQRAAEAEAHKHASAVMKKQYPHHTASKGEGQVYRLSKEEVEQIDEISADTVSNYVQKRTVGYLKTMRGQSSVHPSDVYNKMSDKHKAGIGRAMNRLVKPVKEETVEESRGHKVLATFFKNREVAQRAFNKPQEKKPETKETDGRNKQPVHEQLYKQGRFVSGAGKKPFKAPAIVKAAVNESRKAEIVKDIMKKKKSDKFEAEPELSNTQSKSDQTV